MKSPFFFVLILLACSSQSQIVYPPLSFKGRLMQEIGFTTITVDYERPAARGRTIFGELVPFGKVWRTGAGHCTVIRFSQPVKINNTNLAAGAYSLFTIPRADEWTIIFNKDTSLSGANNYDEKKDALRFNVKPEIIKRFYEAMTIEIDVIPHDADLFIAWANTRVHFLIKTSTDEVMDKRIQQALSKKPTDWGVFNDAAFYYNWQNKPLQSMNVVHEGFKIAGEKECHLAKAQALEKQGLHKEAIEAVSKEMAQIREFAKKKGYDQGIPLQGFEWYKKELEKKAK